MDNSKLIQALIVDRCEIGQDNTGLPTFILTSQEITDIANTIVEKLILPVVVVPKGTLCDNLDANNNCKNMCLTRCIDGNKFWK